MIVGYYKNYLYTTDISSALKEIKKKKIRSPSIWFRTPKPVRIHQSGRTRIGGVTDFDAQLFAEAMCTRPMAMSGFVRKEFVP